jgi:transposase
MNAYSKDLRIKALGALDRGMPRKEAASTFGISLASLKRWLKQRREGEDIAPRPSPGRTPRILATREQRRALWEQLEENDDATLARHCELWERRRGVAVSVATMSRAVRRLGWTFKKASLGATERDERARGSFRERLRGVEPERLRFVDESSTNVALIPRYGRAPKGERARGSAPRNWGKNVTLICSISLEGMGPSMSIEGPSDTDSFGIYMREILAPTLKAGQLVLMDNLSLCTRANGSGN